MDIYEKAGDLVIDLAKLIFGGVILASIISENVNTTVLYIVGAIVTVAFIISGFLLYTQKRKK
jgi:low temperature requirement protein LtrA